MAVNVPVYSKCLSPQELKHYILTELDHPIVFKGIIKSWHYPLSWTQEKICRLLADVTTILKICPKRSSACYKNKFPQNQVIFETDCDHIEAKFSEIQSWFEQNDIDENCPQEPKRLKHSTDSNSLLQLYPRADYWIYADYKYMSELCIEHKDMLESVDWSVFGFNGRDGNQSTLWVGSECASTPCHYDTYGCNLVAQLSGRKKWTLFPPEDSDSLYPTRVPFEESSVFSLVDVCNPQLQETPLFKNTSPHQVILSPGDVLFVPFHWWHYVESIETAVSVNTWIDMPQDNAERVKEAIARTLVSSLIDEEDQLQSLVNPNEVVFSHQENLSLLNTVLKNSRLPQAPILTTTDLINVITSNRVLKTIMEGMLPSKEHPSTNNC